MTNERGSSYSVLIIDDGFALNALSLLLRDSQIVVIDNVRALDKALALVQEQVPHVVIVTIHLVSNIQEKLGIIHMIRQISPSTACLALSTIETDEEVRLETIEAGADGWYTLSTLKGDSLINIVKSSAQGQSDLSQGLARKMLIQLIEAREMKLSYRVPRLNDLTIFERDILVRRAKGEAGSEIAYGLNISMASLGRHFRNILRKFFLPEAYQQDN